MQLRIVRYVILPSHPNPSLRLKEMTSVMHICLACLLQDTELQWRRGNVTVTQAVPRANWFLIPSPAIKVRLYHAHHCMVARQARDQLLGFLVKLLHPPVADAWQCTILQVKQQRTFSQPGRNDFATSLVLDHNTLLARTRLTGSVYGGPDRAYKAVVHLDSLTVRLPVTCCPDDY